MLVAADLAYANIKRMTHALQAGQHAMAPSPHLLGAVCSTTRGETATDMFLTSSKTKYYTRFPGFPVSKYKTDGTHSNGPCLETGSKREITPLIQPTKG